MIPFVDYIYVCYFIIGIFGYVYLKNSYFPQFPSAFERFIAFVLALFWIISVPITFILKDSDSDVISMESSYEGFTGREQ